MSFGVQIPAEHPLKVERKNPLLSRPGARQRMDLTAGRLQICQEFSKGPASKATEIPQTMYGVYAYVHMVCIKNCKYVYIYTYVCMEYQYIMYTHPPS